MPNPDRVTSKLDAQEHKKTVLAVIKENIKLNPILPFTVTAANIY